MPENESPQETIRKLNDTVLKQAGRIDGLHKELQDRTDLLNRVCDDYRPTPDGCGLIALQIINDIRVSLGKEILK
jgi:hypothetical protein